MGISLDDARAFVMGHARLLDRRRWERAVDGGRADDVLSALRAYRNADGGFGHALEPDVRGSSSQPVGAQIALGTLLEVGRRDDDLEQSVVRWCARHSSGPGLPFVLPTVAEAARAPWWVAEPTASLNPTAAVVGHARALALQDDWLDGAEAFCWEALAGGLDELEPHAALCATTLVAAVPAPPGVEQGLQERVVGHLAALDPATPGYVLSPLVYAPTPSSLARAWFADEVIEAHLDALEARQQSDGGWPLTWDPPTPGAVHEWRGQVTVDAVRTLQAYGRVGDSVR